MYGICTVINAVTVQPATFFVEILDWLIHNMLAYVLQIMRNILFQFCVKQFF